VSRYCDGIKREDICTPKRIRTVIGGKLRGTEDRGKERISLEVEKIYLKFLLLGKNIQLPFASQFRRNGISME